MNFFTIDAESSTSPNHIGPFKWIFFFFWNFCGWLDTYLPLYMAQNNKSPYTVQHSK